MHLLDATVLCFQGSLPYELLNYFNSYYVYVWLFFEFFIFIYKGAARGPRSV